MDLILVMAFVWNDYTAVPTGSMNALRQLLSYSVTKERSKITGFWGLLDARADVADSPEAGVYS
jgi:hypothetical protein